MAQPWLQLLGYAAGAVVQYGVEPPPVTTRTIEMKTLADAFNQGGHKSPSYRFANGRTFTQSGDEEII